MTCGINDELRNDNVFQVNIREEKFFFHTCTINN